MSKRLAAFRKAAGFQGQRPSAVQRGGEPTRLPWHGLQECCGALVGGGGHEHEGHFPGGANVLQCHPTELAGGGKRRRGGSSPVQHRWLESGHVTGLP